jgi:hypothetical protein
MSPELIKCFIHQLSLDLNALVDINVLLLHANRITHLLWADDLVILAFDGEGLCAMLNVLLTYCLDWGLNVKVNNTAVLAFNLARKTAKRSQAFTLGGSSIPSAREYFYLGVTFTLSEATKNAHCPKQTKANRSSRLLLPQGKN